MKNLIFPELMRGGNWRVDFVEKKTHGRTSPDDHFMIIPKGDSPLEKFVRMHELSHAKWSPEFALLKTKYPKLNWKSKQVTDALLIAEDGRINYLMLKSGIQGIKKGAIEFYDSQINVPNAPLLYLGIITQAFVPECFNQAMRNLRLFDRKSASIIRRVRKIWFNYANDFDKSTIQVIKLLLSLAKSKEEEKQQQQGQGKQQEQGNSENVDISEIIVCAQLEDPEKREKLNQQIKKSQTKVQAEVKEKTELKSEEEAGGTSFDNNNVLQQEFSELGLDSKYVRQQLIQDETIVRRFRDDLYHREHGTWGTLSLEIPTLSKLISKKPAIRHRYSDSGILVRQVYRHPIDGMIFVEQHRNFREGTVLVDCSGSMHLSVEEIERVVLQCPGMLVAGYAGHRSGTGILRIFAKNGKMCTREQLNLEMGENVVDFPSLEWLSKQKIPRFWVSDGNVTGTGGVFAKVLAEEAFNFIKSHRILRVSSLPELEANCLKYRI